MMVPCRHRVYQTPEQRCSRTRKAKDLIFTARHAPGCTWPPAVATTTN